MLNSTKFRLGRIFNFCDRNVNKVALKMRWNCPVVIWLVLQQIFEVICLELVVSNQIAKGMFEKPTDHSSIEIFILSFEPRVFSGGLPNNYSELGAWISMKL